VDIIEKLKKETLSKPSSVAYREISPGVYVSVKRFRNSLYDDDFTWTYSASPDHCSESMARKLLQDNGVAE
jgi:hypothetical protein